MEVVRVEPTKLQLVAEISLTIACRSSSVNPSTQPKKCQGCVTDVQWRRRERVARSRRSAEESGWEGGQQREKGREGQRGRELDGGGEERETKGGGGKRRIETSPTETFHRSQHEPELKQKPASHVYS
eukprot:755152-Hanusia_phi.AAC.3